MSLHTHTHTHTTCTRVCVCVCVCVFLFMLHCTNVPTRIVKPEIFDIVGTGLQSPWGKEYKKIINDVIWKCNNANRFSVRGRFRVRVGLGDRKYCLVSIKVIYTIHRNLTCVCVSMYVYIWVFMCLYKIHFHNYIYNYLQPDPRSIKNRGCSRELKTYFYI